MTSRDGADADERIFESRAGQMPRRSRAAPPPAVVAEEAIGASDDTAPPRRGRAGRAPCGEDPKGGMGRECVGRPTAEGGRGGAPRDRASHIRDKRPAKVRRVSDARDHGRGCAPAVPGSCRGCVSEERTRHTTEACHERLMRQAERIRALGRGLLDSVWRCRRTLNSYCSRCLSNADAIVGDARRGGWKAHASGLASTQSPPRKLSAHHSARNLLIHPKT